MNGKAEQVHHPECLALGKNRRIVVDPPTHRAVHLSLIHVNAIEALQAAK